MKLFMLSLPCLCTVALASFPCQATEPDTATRELVRSLGLEEAAQPVRNWPRWRKPGKILLTIPSSVQAREAELVASLRTVAGGAEIITVSSAFRSSPDTALLQDADVYLGFCTPALMRTAKNLRWLQHYGTGLDHCVMAPEIRETGFILTNAQHTAGPPIAEHVIAMMMMLTRNLQHFHSRQGDGDWQRPPRTPAPMLEVSGKTLLVAGLGGIGTEVARRAHGLGMRVLATRRSSREGPDFVDYVGLSDELLVLAGKADVIVNALPLTRETTGLFDRKFFAAARHGSYFISIGRGRSTVTADLVAALKEGRLAGAGLDVTDPEPLPAEHELWTLPNVIITPHIAWMTDRGFERNWLVVRENVRRYVNGEPLLNVVDIKRGY